MTRLQGFHTVYLCNCTPDEKGVKVECEPEHTAARFGALGSSGEPHKGRSADRFLKGSVRKRGVEIKTTCKRALVCKASWTIRRPRGDTRWVRAHWFVMSDASNFARR